MPKIPGIEYAISSDDLFFIKKPPKRVLIVGGGYIGLECASYLNNLGSKVILTTRNEFMNKFDLQISDKLKFYLKNSGLIFYDNTSILSIRKEAGRLFVNTDRSFKQYEVSDFDEGFDIILFAISREINSKSLNLHRAFKGEVKTTSDGRIKGGFNGETERIWKNVYAIGDCLEGVPQLTPIAIRSGRLVSEQLAERLANSDRKVAPIDYNIFPSTMFTVPEYAFVGLSEQQANITYGENNVICFHRESSVLEKSLGNKSGKAYFKIVCLRGNANNILGMHFIGPNAGEIIQGYYFAMTQGLTKTMLDQGFSIHPTIAEDFIEMDKLSTNPDPSKVGCCN